MWPVKYLRAQREHALRLLPRSLHHYLSERVLPSSWYPAADYWKLIDTVATLAGGGPESLPEMGRFTANADLQAIYKNVVKERDPLSTLRGVTVLFRNYHSEGSLRVVESGASSASVFLEGYPLPHRQLCGLLTGYLPVVVEQSGGAGTQCEKAQCRNSGAETCQWDLRWL